MENYIRFSAERFEKYGLWEKTSSKSFFRIKFPTKKLAGAFAYLPPEWS